MPEMKIKLAKIDVRKAGSGWSAGIVGVGDDKWFSKFCDSKEEAEKCLTPLVDNTGCELAIDYEEKQSGGKVYKNWQDFQIINADGVKVPEAVSSVRAKRISEQLSRVADAIKVYELGMGILREDLNEGDKANVVALAINLGWDK